MRFKQYIEEKVAQKVNVEKMGDNEILKFYEKHKKSNFNHLSGNIFTSLIDEIKLRKLTRKMTDKNIASIA